jgi:hypothetical protein
MPLEEKIDRVIVGARDAEAMTVRSGAFARTARQTGLRIYSMRAPARAAGAPDAAGALIAGYDLLIDAADPEAAFWAVASAIERGELTLDRLDAAVARLLLTLAEARAITPRD